ncbi:hypothetical protein, partial [Paenibacillus cookii]|uniref:hypothetical protein n=1 Tax=Paenibacillus cookii TaxID=157839 RepID=UPI001BB4366E
VKEANYTEPEQFIVRLASLGAVWQQGVIPQVQTTRWTGGYDFWGLIGQPLMFANCFSSAILFLNLRICMSVIKSGCKRIFKRKHPQNQNR